MSKIFAGDCATCPVQTWCNSEERSATFEIDDSRHIQAEAALSDIHHGAVVAALEEAVTAQIERLDKRPVLDGDESGKRVVAYAALEEMRRDGMDGLEQARTIREAAITRRDTTIARAQRRLDLVKALREATGNGCEKGASELTKRWSGDVVGRKCNASIPRELLNEKAGIEAARAAFLEDYRNARPGERPRPEDYGF